MKFAINDIPKIQKIGVYAVHNKVNDRYYIGSAFNLYKRLSQHELNLRLRNILAESPKIYDDFVKYGKDNFEFLILETFDNGTIEYEDLYQKEKEYVIRYNSIYPNGYNTMYPALTNNKKRGQYIVCHTVEEDKQKRKEYNKNMMTFTARVTKSDKERYRQHAQSQGKSLNALIIDLLEQDIAEKGGI